MQPASHLDLLVSPRRHSASLRSQRALIHCRHHSASPASVRVRRRKRRFPLNHHGCRSISSAQPLASTRRNHPKPERAPQRTRTGNPSRRSVCTSGCLVLRTIHTARRRTSVPAWRRGISTWHPPRPAEPPRGSTRFDTRCASPTQATFGPPPECGLSRAHTHAHDEAWPAEQARTP